MESQQVTSNQWICCFDRNMDSVVTIRIVGCATIPCVSLSYHPILQLRWIICYQKIEIISTHLILHPILVLVEKCRWLSFLRKNNSNMLWKCQRKLNCVGYKTLSKFYSVFVLNIYIYYFNTVDLTLNFFLKIYIFSFQ